jgi:hypothetical protein
MTLNDLYAAQIEAHFFTLLMAGVCTACLCLTLYIVAKIIAEAISQQKIVIREAVYDASPPYQWHNQRAMYATPTPIVPSFFPQEIVGAAENVIKT